MGKVIERALYKLSKDKEMAEKFKILKDKDPDKAYEIALSVSNEKFSKKDFLDFIAKVRTVASATKSSKKELGDSDCAAASGGTSSEEVGEAVKNVTDKVVGIYNSIRDLFD